MRLPSYHNKMIFIYNTIYLDVKKGLKNKTKKHYFFKYLPYLSGIIFQYKQKLSQVCNAVRM